MANLPEETLTQIFNLPRQLFKIKNPFPVRVIENKVENQLCLGTYK